MPDETKPPSLDDLAEFEGWLELGAGLLTAVSNPESYGLDKAQDVLREVARRRRRKADYMGRLVTAARLMQHYFPEVFEEGQTSLTQQDVHRFSALLQRSGGRIEAIRREAKKVVRDQLRFRAFMDDFERKSDRKTPGIGPAQGKVAFTKGVARRLKPHLPYLFPDQAPILKKGRHLRPDCDLVVAVDDTDTVAIDCRPARLSINESFILQLLGIIKLREAIQLEQWLILDRSWIDHLPKMEDLMSEFDVCVALIGLLDQETGEFEWRDPPGSGKSKVRRGA